MTGSFQSATRRAETSFIFAELDSEQRKADESRQWPPQVTKVTERQLKFGEASYWSD